MRRRVLAFTALAVLALAAHSRAEGEVAYADSIAAVVGNEIITVYQLHEETRQVEKQLRERLQGEELKDQVMKLRQMAAVQLVERELIAAEFKAIGAQVPPKLIQERANRVIVARCGGDRRRFEEMLHNDGVSMEDFRKDIRRRLAVDMYLQEFVFSRVQTGPAAVDAYFQASKNQFSTSARIRPQVILLKDDGAYAGKIEATAASIITRARNGEAFVALAKEFSEGPNVDEGGDLGWMDAEDANEQLAEAVSGLATGDVAEDPVTIGSNTYIVRLAERQAGGDAVLDESVRKEIEQRLRKQEEQRRYRELILRLRKKYFVKTFF